MKNFKMSKKLLALLLTGGIAVTTLGCTLVRNKGANVAPVPISTSVAEAFPTDAPIAGEVTLTENIINLPAEVSLTTQEAVVVSEPVNEVMRYYEQYNINDNIHAKAATLRSTNIRKGPGTGYEVIDTLYRGYILEVLGKTNNGWYLVDYEGQLCFITEANITMLNYMYDGMTLNDIVPNLTLAIQPTTGLNVRERATKDSHKVGFISGNRTYKVLELLSNGWYKIDYQGRVAYVCGKYCHEVFMLDGRFYQYVYATQDCCLYDQDGNVKRYLEKYEGGPVYNEDDEKYLVWIGDDWGYMLRRDVKIAPSKVINVDLSLQEVTVYDGCEMILQMDTCTGKKSTPTDKGVYSLGSETGPTVLRGPGYECPVDNFASVNGGEGFHPYKCDNFGDVDGAASHGCYRLPPERYQEFFDVTYPGDMVVTHK